MEAAVTYEKLDDIALERWAETGDPDAVAELERRRPDRGGFVIVFGEENRGGGGTMNDEGIGV